MTTRRLLLWNRIWLALFAILALSCAFNQALSSYKVTTKIEELGISPKYYTGRSPHQQSHGGRSWPSRRTACRRGLYVLDEPEAALPPARWRSCEFCPRKSRMTPACAPSPATSSPIPSATCAT